MFFDSSDFPFLRFLESRHPEILEEALRVPPADFLVWAQREAYQGCWRVFPLLSADPEWLYAENVRRNALRCPRTTQIVQRIPGALLAAYSLLDPGTHIYTHADHALVSTVRCHLGLRIPPGGGMRIGDEVRGWVESRCLGFDSKTPHEAANTSVTDRLVLLVDVDRSCAELPVPGWDDPGSNEPGANEHGCDPPGGSEPGAQPASPSDQA